jgi:hypothetical protein
MSPNAYRTRKNVLIALNSLGYATPESEVSVKSPTLQTRLATRVASFANLS